MKHLLTAFACLFAMSLSAQTYWPYNPDFDYDGMITVEDLMSVLSNFGSEWTMEESAIEGCTDPLACNYNGTATEDDGSCIIPAFCNQGLGKYGIFAGNGTHYIPSNVVLVYISVTDNGNIILRLPEDAAVGHTIHFLMDAIGNATCCASGNQCPHPQFQENVDGSWGTIGSFDDCVDYIGTIPGAKATRQVGGWAIN